MAGTLRQRLQLVEKPVLREQLTWITASQQLVQNILVDCHIDGLPVPSCSLAHKILTVLMKMPVTISEPPQAYTMRSPIFPTRVR